MEDVGTSEPKINQEREKDIFGQFRDIRDGTKNNRRGAIEYFLTKLKRVDDEMRACSAELREVNEEISRKDFKIERLKMRLENLKRDETNREIHTLEQMKDGLKEHIKKADRVLAGLGLIWVGENGAKTNADLGVRFIPSPEGSSYRPHQGYREITNDQSTVTPFTGKGFRLGTGSEIFGKSVEELDVDRISVHIHSEPPSRKQSEVHAPGAGSSPRGSLRSALTPTSSDSRIRLVDAVGKIKTNTMEKVPPKFRLMSESEKLRAKKQVSFQIQKNMNKYTT